MRLGLRPRQVEHDNRGAEQQEAQRDDRKGLTIHERILIVSIASSDLPPIGYF